MTATPQQLERFNAFTMPELLEYVAMHGIDAVPANSDARMMLTLLANPQGQYRRRKNKKAGLAEGFTMTPKDFSTNAAVNQLRKEAEEALQRLRGTKSERTKDSIAACIARLQERAVAAGGQPARGPSGAMAEIERLQKVYAMSLK